MSHADPAREPLLELLTVITRVETLLNQARSRIGDIRYHLNAELWPVKDLDDLDHGHSTPVCRHAYPIGEFCPYCIETPEG